MALDIFMGSSSIRTTSAASMAASEPIAPMAMPISARESTGASFMPSPTKASLPFLPVSASSFSTYKSAYMWNRFGDIVGKFSLGDTFTVDSIKYKVTDLATKTVEVIQNSYKQVNMVNNFLLFEEQST